MGDRADENDENSDADTAYERKEADDDNGFGRYTMEIDDRDEGDFQRNVYIEDELLPGRNTTSRMPYFEKIKVPGKLPGNSYFDMVARLDNKQRLFLTHVMHHIRNNKDETIVQYFNTTVVPPSNNTFPPLHLLVKSGVGTGKSLIINVLCQSPIREFDSDPDREMMRLSVLLCAPTGMAAFNIYDQTLHAVFEFPNSQNTLSALSADVSHSMSVALRDLKIVIIDEISMVSKLSSF